MRVKAYQIDNSCLLDDIPTSNGYGLTTRCFVSKLLIFFPGERWDKYSKKKQDDRIWGLRYYSGQRPYNLLMRRIKAYKVYKSLKSDEFSKSNETYHVTFCACGPT